MAPSRPSSSSLLRWICLVVVLLTVLDVGAVSERRPQPPIKAIPSPPSAVLPQRIEIEEDVDDTGVAVDTSSALSGEDERAIEAALNQADAEKAREESLRKWMVENHELWWEELDSMLRTCVRMRYLHPDPVWSALGMDYTVEHALDDCLDHSDE